MIARWSCPPCAGDCSESLKTAPRLTGGVPNWAPVVSALHFQLDRQLNCTATLHWIAVLISLQHSPWW